MKRQNYKSVCLPLPQEIVDFLTKEGETESRKLTTHIRHILNKYVEGKNNNESGKQK